MKISPFFYGDTHSQQSKLAIPPFILREGTEILRFGTHFTRTLSHSPSSSSWMRRR